MYENNSFRTTNGFALPNGEMTRFCNISDMIGKIIIDIKYTENEFFIQCEDESSNEIYYHFYHDQDCCESVWLDDISGDLSDLLDYPLLKAEEKTSEDRITPKTGSLDESVTWTFYTLATVNGYVDLKWCGTSNGYYSEKATIDKIVETIM